MSKFNKIQPGSVKRPAVRVEPDTVNKAGGRAFSKSAESELASRLLTSFVVGSYYDTEVNQLADMAKLIPTLPDKKFAAQAAIYARNVFNMRSITHALVGELVLAMHQSKESGGEWLRPAIAKIVNRPDDILEILSYWDTKKQKSLSKAMQRGLRDSFNQFDSYQLRKWAGQNAKGGWNLVDAIRVLHPSPTDRNIDALRELIHQDRVVQDTRQANMVKATQEAIAELGKNASKEEKAKASSKAKAATWEKQLANPKKVPYMDLLKNLRSIAVDAPDQIYAAIAILTNPEHVKKSRLFPFRFLNASRALEVHLKGNQHLPRILGALSDVLDLSCTNLPVLKNSLIVIDTSGSMQAPVSVSKKDLKRYERMGTTPLSRVQAGALFGAMLAKVGYGDIMIFGNSAEYVPYNPRDSAIGITNKICGMIGVVGHGTNFNEIFNGAKRQYDRIVIFSDMQGWVPDHNGSGSFHGFGGYYRGGAPVNSFNRYCQKYGKPWVYMVDLAHYGTAMLPEDDSKVIPLAGFSEKLFDLMSGAEQDPNILVNEIKKIELV